MHISNDHFVLSSETAMSSINIACIKINLNSGEVLFFFQNTPEYQIIAIKKKKEKRTVSFSLTPPTRCAFGTAASSLSYEGETIFCHVTFFYLLMNMEQRNYR